MLNSNEKPLVSVLTTVYNREAYLRDTILSVLQSTYTHFEYIIVDDCSTDNSLAIAREMAATDSRIRVYANEKNLTDYPNRNKAASYAKGKYLKYVDSDDMLYPYGLEILVNRMEQFPKAAVGFSKFILPHMPAPIFLTPEESYRWAYFKGNNPFFSSASTAIIVREAFESCGGFSGLNQVGDYEFWLKLCRQHPLLILEPGTCWQRDTPGSEKYKDSQLEKDKMKFNLDLAALGLAEAPLTFAERHQAIKKVQVDYNRNKFRKRFGGLIRRLLP